MSRIIEYDIEVFFTALEYKFKEGYDKEYLYDLIFEISNNNQFCMNKSIMKSLSFILENNWDKKYFTPANGTDLFYKYYKDESIITNNAKNFSIYGNNDFFRDKILNLLSFTALNLNYRSYYIVNLFKSYSDTKNNIYQNKNFQNFFNEVKSNLNNEKTKKEDYSLLIDLLNYDEFKEIEFYVEFYKGLDTQFWIELIRDKDLKDIINLYNYDIKNRKKLDINIFGSFLIRISDILLATNHKPAKFKESEIKQVFDIITKLLGSLIKPNATYQDNKNKNISYYIIDILKDKLSRIQLIEKGTELSNLISLKIIEEEEYKSLKGYENRYNENTKEVISLFIQFIKSIDFNIIMNNEYIFEEFNRIYNIFKVSYEQKILNIFNENSEQMPSLHKSTIENILNSKTVYFHNVNILLLIFTFYDKNPNLSKLNEEKIKNKRIYIHINYLDNKLSVFYKHKQIKDKKHIEAYDGYYELFFLEDDEYKLDNKNSELWVELKLSNDITIFEYINRLVKRLNELYPENFGENLSIEIEE